MRRQTRSAALGNQVHNTPSPERATQSRYVPVASGVSFALSGLRLGAVLSTQGGAALCPGLTCCGPDGAGGCSHGWEFAKGEWNPWLQSLTPSASSLRRLIDDLDLLGGQAGAVGRVLDPTLARAMKCRFDDPSYGTDAPLGRAVAVCFSARCKPIRKRLDRSPGDSLGVARACPPPEQLQATPLWLAPPL